VPYACALRRPSNDRYRSVYPYCRLGTSMGFGVSLGFRSSRRGRCCRQGVHEQLIPSGEDYHRKLIPR
jgi:hypothetical protein